MARSSARHGDQDEAGTRSRPRSRRGRGTKGMISALMTNPPKARQGSARSARARSDRRRRAPCRFSFLSWDDWLDEKAAERRALSARRLISGANLISLTEDERPRPAAFARTGKLVRTARRPISKKWKRKSPRPVSRRGPYLLTM